MRVRFIVFKGTSIVSKVIRFVTRSSSYSHVGYLDKIGQLVECWMTKKNPFSHWIISSLENHKPGTSYEIWELDVPLGSFITIDKYFAELVVNDTKYDWIGVLGFVFKFLRDKPTRLFCSEGCITPLVTSLCWFKINPAHISPQNFVELIQAAGGICTKRGKT